MTTKTKLTDVQRGQILIRLSSEPSDTKLANEFGVSRKTIWRLRQEGLAPSKPAIQMAAVRIPIPMDEEVPIQPEPANEVKAEPPMPDAIAPPPPETPSAVTVPPAPPLPSVSRSAELRQPPPTRDLRPRSKSDVRPKVDVTEEVVVMSTYFAVQLFRGETYSDLAKLILEEADRKGVLFRKLQVLDIPSVGGTSFVRFRSDIDDALSVVRGLVERATITQCADGFYAAFPSGRTGKYPTSAMCVGPKVGFGRTFVGTRIKRWKQQFAA